MKKDGVGIGLAVSRSIVGSHEGQLWAENNPDFGAPIHSQTALGEARSMKGHVRSLPRLSSTRNM
jgi:K+-sensing histidine kinase KdpD